MLVGRREYLESLARRMGYNPERDDTDADLVVVCRLRGLPWVN